MTRHFYRELYEYVQFFDECMRALNALLNLQSRYLIYYANVAKEEEVRRREKIIEAILRAKNRYWSYRQWFLTQKVPVDYDVLDAFVEELEELKTLAWYIGNQIPCQALLQQWLKRYDTKVEAEAA